MRPRALVTFLAVAACASPSVERGADGGGWSGVRDAAIDGGRAKDPTVGIAEATAYTDDGAIDYQAWFVVGDRDGEVWSVETATPRSFFTQLLVPAGAMVTILHRGHAGDPERTTFLGVERGDVLVPASAPPSQHVEGTATVRVPRFATDVRRYQAELAGGCEGTVQIPPDRAPDPVVEIRVQIVTGCVDLFQNHQLLVVSAFDATGRRVGTISRYESLPREIDLSGATWSPTTTASLAVTALPPGPDAGRILCLRGWAAEPTLRHQVIAHCEPMPPGAGDFVTTDQVTPEAPIVWEQTAQLGGSGRVRYEELHVSPDPAAALDLSWTSRPAPTLEIDPQGARPEVRVAGELADYVGGVTSIADGAGSWTVVHPPVASFRLPALPDDLAAYRLSDGARDTETQLFLPGQFATYAELRTAILPPIARQPTEQRSFTVQAAPF